MTPDDCIRDMWKICTDMDEDADVRIDCMHDQWWGVVVACPHGRISATSNGNLDLGRGFVRALVKFEDLHWNPTG